MPSLARFGALCCYEKEDKMKRFFALSIFLAIVFASLCSCSLDFSDEIGDKMNDLYDEVYDASEPFLKEDESYSSDSGSASLPESKPTVPDSGSEGGSTGGEGGSSGSLGGNNGTGDEDLGGNDTPQESIQIGTNVGQRLPEVSLEIFDENGLTGEMLRPTQLGKVTVINFWGTWCHFCLEELPAFDEVASAYKGDVYIVAIHTVDCFELSAPKYVSENFSDSEIIFLKDENNSGYLDEAYTLYGGAGSYPYTIIIDENGVITYKGFGALEYNELKALVNHALGN